MILYARVHVELNIIDTPPGFAVHSGILCTLSVFTRIWMKLENGNWNVWFLISGLPFPFPVQYPSFFRVRPFYSRDLNFRFCLFYARSLKTAVLLPESTPFILISIISFTICCIQVTWFLTLDINLVWQPRPFALLWKVLASAVSKSCTSRRNFCDPIRLQKRTAESINYEYS